MAVITVCQKRHAHSVGHRHPDKCKEAVDHCEKMLFKVQQAKEELLKTDFNGNYNGYWEVGGCPACTHKSECKT